MTESIFRCDNARCREPLNVDHVTMITTAHVRRFCCVECIIEGYEAHMESIFAQSSESYTEQQLAQLDAVRAETEHEGSS